MHNFSFFNNLRPEDNNVRPVPLTVSLTGGEDGGQTPAVLTDERGPVVDNPALLVPVVTPVSPHNLTAPGLAGHLRAEAKYWGKERVNWRGRISTETLIKR